MIAISYRREDTLPVAGRLYDRLEAKFGKQNIFMDFDSIRPGLDFRDQIRETIERAEVVIAIIGPHWLGEQRDKSRRIDDPADFVRLEIAHALQRRIPVIPVLVNNTEMPKSAKLPPEIKELSFRHAVPLDSGLDFRQHADRLIASIVALIDEKKDHLLPGQGTTESSAKNKSRPTMIAVCGAAVLLLILGAMTVWFSGLLQRPSKHEVAETTPVKEHETLKTPTTDSPANLPVPNTNTVSIKPAEIAPPNATAATSPLQSEEEQAQQLIRDYYAAFSRHDLDGVVSKFADTVNYQGQGLRPKSYIRGDAANYLRRWDRISFYVGQIAFSRTPEGDLVARFDSPFQVGERNAPDKSGVSSNVWILRKDLEGGLHIVSQQENVLNGRAGNQPSKRSRP